MLFQSPNEAREQFQAGGQQKKQSGDDECRGYTSNRNPKDNKGGAGNKEPILAV